MMTDYDWSQLERAASSGVRRPPGSTGAALWLSPRGRISRGTYWLKFLLPICALQFGATIIDVVMGFEGPDEIGPAAVLATLVLFWPAIVGAVKRLHDLGHPGWFVPAFYGGVVGAGIALAVALPVLGDAAMVLMIPLLVLMLASTWYTIKMMAFRGVPGPNQYGPDPIWRA